MTEDTERNQEHSNEGSGINRLLSIAFPVLFIFYEELLLKWFTLKGPWNITVFYTWLFSAAFGLLIFLITSLSKHPGINRFARVLVCTFIAVVFGVNVFVYRTFKMFYDVQTVLAGGRDALGGFGGDVRKMVFSSSGLARIALILLPVILYLLVFRKMDSGKRLGIREGVTIFLLSLLFYARGEILVSMNPTAVSVYTDEYAYQNAISNFGLLSGIRLDAVQFANRNDTTAQFAAIEPEETEEKPVIYGYNRMDIDFDAISTGAGTPEQNLDEYVQTVQPSHKNEYTGLFQGKNLIFISAEAFSAEVIDPVLTPTLYRLANKGIQFTDYYQPASAGTTGGEYENIFGLLPIEGGSSFKITSRFHNNMIMGSVLNRQGYNGWAFHNNDYTFYDRHITHNNLGYSNGFMGCGNGMEQWVDTSGMPESDLEMMEGTIDLYINKEPFNIYYMTVSGHSMYDRNNPMTKRHWEEVKDLEGYTESVKCYLGANLELEAAMKYLVERLEKKGIADNTVIVIAADHFPYGLDYGEDIDTSDNLANLYGHKVTDYLDRDHNRLILWSGCLEDKDPIVVDTPTSSLDILPTLLNLFGAEWDSRLLPGRDVFSDRSPLVFTLNYDWKTDKGTYYGASGIFVPNEGVTVSDTYAENIRKVVKNKINYCRGLLHTDYFHHVFPDLE
ncbi:MAG: sulfatase-like hydrolase/transferase [Solobacterium sp.]|nr:sulfatase-like hydrolase/transferase [Solobacterium sp.]